MVFVLEQGIIGALFVAGHILSLQIVYSRLSAICGDVFLYNMI